MQPTSTLSSLASLALCVAAIVAATPSVAQETNVADGDAEPRIVADASASDPAALTIELNKLETTEAPACRTFFLFRNETGLAFEGFEMSLAILDNDGIINQLLNIDAAPLPVARTTLRLFEIPGIACADVSEILMHAIDVCKPQNAPETDCFEFLSLVSRTDAELVK